MSTLISSSVTEINPSLLFSDGFELSDQTIIPNEEIVSSFVPDENKVELFIYDSNNFLLDSNYNFEDWTIIKNSSTSPPNTDTIELDPSRDLINRGFDIGTLYNVYNFVNYELQSSPENLYFISEISSDRTEIRLKSNFISNEDIASSVLSLKQKIESAEFFDEFYIAFDGNNYNIAINLQLDDTQEQYSVLIKLYDALPAQFEVKDELYIATKVAESKAYQVDFTLDESQLGLSDVTYLRGPNTNLEIKDFVNNSTELKSKSELLSSNSTSSEFNLQSILNRKGVTITPDYSYDTFDEFVHFSSAKKRIENFYYKVGQIESYQNDLDTLNSITGATSASFQVSSSKAALDANIENIIKNFDGYEYYLYYNNSAYAYPKSTTTFPYELYSTGSTQVLEWLGSDVEGSQYYGGILLSASLYDESNQNWLYYTIPEFIRNNNDNDNYIEFTNMVGQHFDELWLYTKAVSEKLNTTNELDKGIPLKMAQDAIRSLGYEGLSNNYNNQDNFIGLTGEDNGIYFPPTGSELITNYIAVNGGQIVNYWNPAYSFLYYVESINEPGFPYAIDDVSKEIYKRLYHNMAYLVKKKGTISGLRQLINIWGVPNTILRINEFGGKNKDNSDDYDYWYNRYSYAFTPVANQEFASASVRVPWMPLERNRIADGEYIVPDSLQFRFKTFGIPAGNFTSQSLVVKKSDGDNTSTDFDFGVALFYTGSATGSYSGSSNNEYEEYGVMRFYISGAAADGGTAVSNDIYLPFFDKGWWSVMLQRNQHVSASDNTNATTYTLYAKNKTYNGWDGNSIGFEGSASIVSNVSQSINEAWNKFGTTTSDGVYIGGFVSGSTVGSVTIQDTGYIFSGSLQEFKYYSNDIPETVFNDFVMNPESIEGNATTGSESSFDIVNFRAPLGNELEDDFTITDSSSFTETLTSFHPAADTSYAGLNTASFVNPATNATSSTYDILYYANETLRTYSKINTEVYFLDQPSIGVRNRVTNKIEVVASQSYGNILSKDISIQQNYQINQDYTEDITSLEVAFSPQDEVNDDIIQTFGYGVVSDTLADPRFTSESLDYYPRLRETAQYYFQKYKKGNIYDYIRLIKYFDNSLFKAIKAYVPARTNVNTGIIIKQHMLERNRYAPPSITQNTQLATSPQPAFNTGLIFQNLELTSSLAIGTFEGGTGGVVENFNYTGSPSFGETPISQSYTSSIAGPAGLVVEIEDTQKEFYDGEYSGSELIVADKSLFPNPFKKSTFDPIYYNWAVSSSLNLLGEATFEWSSSGDLNTAYGYLDNFTPSIDGRSAISLYDDGSNLYIVAIALNPTIFTTGEDYSDYILTTEKNPWPTTPIPWDTGSYTFNEFAPYFYFDISGITGSGTFNTDSNFNNIGFEKIYSSPFNTQENKIINGLKLFLFSPDESRGISKSGITIPSDRGTFTTNLLIGSFPGVKQSAIDTQIDLPSEGSGSVWFYPLDYTASFDSSDPMPPSYANQWSPVAISLNNIDANGKLLNPTFIQQPNFRFTLNNGGTAASSDSFGLAGNIVDTQYLNVDYYPAFSPNNYSIIYNSNNNLGRVNEGSGDFILLPTQSLTIFNPYIQSIIGVNVFQNSDYYALLNNYNDNRGNTFYRDLDFSSNPSVPVNRLAIISGSATPAQTPDSNYTTARIIRPRYEGSRVSSVDYNNYTPASSNLTFINGDTGSWGGDVSYGKRATIDKNPIYFAHFKNSKESREIFDTYTFRIDALIEVPKDPIEGQARDLTLNTIRIDGSNNNLYDVSNTFEPGRKATVNYGRQDIAGVDYSALPIGESDILQGGLEYNLIIGNEPSYTNAFTTCSFITSSWVEPVNNYGNNVTLTPGTYGKDHFMETGSGYLLLQGGEYRLSGSLDVSGTGTFWIFGPGLGLIHSLNYHTSINNPLDYPPETAAFFLGIPQGSTLSNLDENYFVFDISGSGLSVYEDFKKRFLLQRGDEIRVTYNVGTIIPVYETVDFTVTTISPLNTSGTSPNYYYNTISGSTFDNGQIANSSIYSKIEVTPDPSTLNIPEGKIYNFTVRRRVQADDRVVIYQTPPVGAQGQLTPSSEGYLIPGDLSPTQKRNVLTLINNLKEKNAFRQDEDLSARSD